jgi:hypothetical protein
VKSPGAIRLVVVALAAVGALLLAPHAASARVSPKKSMWGPVTYHGRPQFPIYADLGVGIFQMPLRWNQVAVRRPERPGDPTDPAYRWPLEVDQAVAEGARYGIRVTLQVIGAPSWANGGRPWNWVPTDRQDYVAFLRAAAARYPTVRLWMIWGEPTRQNNFMPLRPETQGRVGLTPAQASAPRYYARLLDASYVALKRLHRSNIVIGGNTFTVGDISPYNWIRAMKLPGRRSPRMDMFGHNPFTSRRPDLRNPPPGHGPAVNYSDFSDLDTFTLVLDRHLRDPRGRPLRLFLSEFFFPTDHRNWEFPFYVTRRVQARWLADALRIVRRWKRVYTLGWFGLYDDGPRPDRLEVNRGLIDIRGRRKPSYNAYKNG